MKLLNFTIIKLTLFLVLGIVIGYNFQISLQQSLFISVILLIAFGISLFLTKKLHKPHVAIGILIYATTISIGVFTVNINDKVSSKDHFTNHESLNIDSTYAIKIRIREILKPSAYQNKYVIDILEINNERVSGKSLLNVEKDSAISSLKVDAILNTTSNFVDLIPNLNPHQFNYKNYLHRKSIHHQLYLSNSELLILQNKKHTLFGYASLLRERINTNLKLYHFKDDELAIINALILGQRQDISKEIYSSYAQAGAIHILAISGLHIGIILILLNRFFKPIEYLKNGKIIKIFLIVFLLWSFAIVAGLSASVVRAVTMFTVIAIAMNLKRPTNIYNTLAISIFVLLLVKPSFLFDVGFQLSYLAVLGIVVIQPMIYKIWRPKQKVINFFWNIFTVTIAAQIGIVPVSLYYFHQFPGLFFISNLVIIPALGFILGFGIIIILLSLLSTMPLFVANLYGDIISLMNMFISWISNQEEFLFKNITFGIAYVIISYLLIMVLVIVLKKRNYTHLAIALTIIICCQGFLIFDKSQSSSNSFTVFHRTRFSIIGIQNNRHLVLHHNMNDSILKNDNVITNFRVGEGIKDIKTDSIQSIYKHNNKTILVVDSLGIYNVTTFKPNIILLRNSPKINLIRLIDSLQPELIISDGSNYKSYEERWMLTCEAQKIPFHQTSKKGAHVYYY